ncbi:MAG: hypothetical protein V7703_07175 [Hyphomicrobiales bacterium]
MREYLLQFMGEEAAMGVQFMVALLAVLLLFGLFVWFLRLITGKGRRTPTSQNHRLAVLDRTQIDDTRSLVLVRRDDMEHLVMIGGPSDVVVESNIDPYADEANRNSGQPLPGHEIARRVIAQRPLRTMSLSGSAAAVAESIGLAAASRPEVSLAPPPPAPESAPDRNEPDIPPVEIQLELVSEPETEQDDHQVVIPPEPSRPVPTAAPEPRSVAPQTYAAPPTYTPPPVAPAPPIVPEPQIEPEPIVQEQVASIIAPEAAPVPEAPRTPDPAPQARAEPVPVAATAPAPVAEPEPIAPQPEPVAVPPQPVAAPVSPVVPAAPAPASQRKLEPAPAALAPQPEPQPTPPVEAVSEPLAAAQVIVHPEPVPQPTPQPAPVAATEPAQAPAPEPAPQQPTPVAQHVSVAQPLAEQDFYQAPLQPKPEPHRQPQPVAYAPPQVAEPVSPAEPEPETRDLSAEMENALMQELEQPPASNLSRVNHVARQDPPAMVSPVMREAPIPPAPPVVSPALTQQQEFSRQQDVDLSAGLAEAMGLEPEAPDEPQYSSEQGTQDDMELEDAIAGMLIGDHPQNGTTGGAESSVYSASESVPEGPEPPLDTTRPGRVDDEMSRLLQELAIPSRA